MGHHGQSRIGILSYSVVTMRLDWGTKMGTTIWMVNSTNPLKEPTGLDMDELAIGLQQQHNDSRDTTTAGL